MNKKIVLSFPGSRGSEIPLLYFAAKHYEDLGYEKVPFERELWIDRDDFMEEPPKKYFKS